MDRMAWPQDLPLLLAGPIVRRVEPGLASVWVAVRSPGSVELRLWEGLVDAGTGEGVLFEGRRRWRPAPFRHVPLGRTCTPPW